uniref:Ig-like domain-containing protein n=1 Tax=Strigamia maritima TaxID=126957 RepID=T1J3R3_STRMM
MQRPPRPLSAQKKSQLTCQCVGSRPEASITWWLGRIKLLTTHQYTSLDGNSTESVVTFTPSSTDNGKILVCRAHNPLVPNSEITDNWTLNIYYRPVVTVELTAPPNKWNIIENSNVFLECHIASNPYVLSVTWKFKSKILANDPANGIRISEQSLVIQSVQAHHVGEYVCVATNGEGQGQSEVFDLQIKHVHRFKCFFLFQDKPICSKRQQSKYSFVANNQTLVISCQVEAHPANVTFHWTSASAKGTKTLLPFESLVNQTKSSILYTVDSESDLGTVSCWATNQIGTQIKHCVFHILYAGKQDIFNISIGISLIFEILLVKPHPLRNCTLYNISHSSFQVQCIAKYDDGLAYNFTIEVQDGRTSKVRRNQNQPGFSRFRHVGFSVVLKQFSNNLVLLWF